MDFKVSLKAENIKLKKKIFLATAMWRHMVHYDGATWRL
jgi:hypothetical protein